MITPHDKEIQALVADIRDGKLLLPELQRQYVWKAPQVRDLFDSLYHQYPSGQLLVWETDDIPFSKTTSIDGLETTQRHPQLLLDGQQRLTSLAAILLGRPLVVRGLKRPIDIAFNVNNEKFEVAGPRQRGDLGWISLSRLFTQGTPRIMADLKLDLSSSESYQIFERLNRIQNIATYKYRVNVLENISYNEVTHIFVRINSGGTVLGSADLALAQVSSRWRGVTHEFEVYQQQVAKQGLALDSGLLLRAMAILLIRSSRLSLLFHSDRYEVTVDELQASWHRVKAAMDQSIAFLVQNCKIDRLSLLPTNNILIPLVAFFDRFGNQVSNEQVRDLQRWVYMALIWTRYSGTVETRLDQDAAELSTEQPIQNMIVNIEDQVGRRPVTERELQDQRKNSPYMVMAYVLARQASAQDWFNGVEIGPHQPLEFHHIFPKALLRERYNLRNESRTVDQVANLAFVSRRANAQILSSSPSDYLPKIEQSRLKSQQVPLNPSLWQLDQFEEFLHERRTMLANAINRLLRSLTSDSALWSVSDAQVLESRLNVIERQLREVIDERLIESRGNVAWQQCVPVPIQESVQNRIEKHLRNNPFEMIRSETVNYKLEHALFSEYPQIIKESWQLFDDVFGSKATFDQHTNVVTATRNAFKHNRELSGSELASAEAGLLWFEDCLRHSHVVQDEEVSEDAVSVD